MSSGAGAGSAVLGWLSTAGSSISATSMTSRSHPSSRSANPAVVIAAIGAASVSMNSRSAPPPAAPGRSAQIRRPGLQHRQNRHDRLSRPGKQQRHTLTRAHTLASQPVRQPVSGLLNLAVGPRTLPGADRHRLRGAGHLRGEQHRNRHRGGRGPGQHRPIAPPIQLGVLTVVEQIHRQHPPCGIRGLMIAAPNRRSWPPALA